MAQKQSGNLKAIDIPASGVAGMQIVASGYVDPVLLVVMQSFQVQTTPKPSKQSNQSAPVEVAAKADPTRLMRLMPTLEPGVRRIIIDDDDA